MNRRSCHAETTSWRYLSEICTVAVAVAVCALLSACGSSGVIAPLGRATTQDNVAASAQGVHRVIQGDSLYSIAWRYGVDYQDLSRWNVIAEPYIIYPDQVLRVSRPGELPPMPPSHVSVTQAPIPTRPSQVAAVASRQPPANAAQSSASTTTQKTQGSSTTAPVAALAQTAAEADVNDWRWPVKGSVIGTFGKDGGKGIDIAGPLGTSITSAAPGQVVYSGSGLRGYGKLIIVKHNKRYLSAYAHNDRLHVKEGDTVKGGQRIAEMGNSGAKSVRLHFEIRRDGQPVDPTRFLPR